MDTVTKPTIVVDYDLYAQLPDIRLFVDDRAPHAHLVALNFSRAFDTDGDDVPWDMIISNNGNDDDYDFNLKAARVLRNTALAPAVVLTTDTNWDLWYSFGALYVSDGCPWSFEGDGK